MTGVVGPELVIAQRAHRLGQDIADLLGTELKRDVRVPGEPQRVELRGQPLVGALHLLASRRPRQPQHREVVRVLNLLELGLQPADVQLRGGHFGGSARRPQRHEPQYPGHGEGLEGRLLGNPCPQEHLLQRLFAIHLREQPQLPRGEPEELWLLAGFASRDDGPQAPGFFHQGLRGEGVAQGLRQQVRRRTRGGGERHLVGGRLIDEPVQRGRLGEGIQKDLLRVALDQRHGLGLPQVAPSSEAVEQCPRGGASHQAQLVLLARVDESIPAGTVDERLPRPRRDRAHEAPLAQPEDAQRVRDLEFQAHGGPCLAEPQEQVRQPLLRHAATAGNGQFRLPGHFEPERRGLHPARQRFGLGADLRGGLRLAAHRVLGFLACPLGRGQTLGGFGLQPRLVLAETFHILGQPLALGPGPRGFVPELGECLLQVPLLPGRRLLLTERRLLRQPCLLLPAPQFLGHLRHLAGDAGRLGSRLRAQALDGIPGLDLDLRANLKLGLELGFHGDALLPLLPGLRLGLVPPLLLGTGSLPKCAELLDRSAKLGFRLGEGSGHLLELLLGLGVVSRQRFGPRFRLRPRLGFRRGARRSLRPGLVRLDTPGLELRIPTRSRLLPGLCLGFGLRLRRDAGPRLRLRSRLDFRPGSRFRLRSRLRLRSCLGFRLRTGLGFRPRPGFFLHPRFCLRPRPGLFLYPRFRLCPGLGFSLHPRFRLRTGLGLCVREGFRLRTGPGLGIRSHLQLRAGLGFRLLARLRLCSRSRLRLRSRFYLHPYPDFRLRSRFRFGPRPGFRLRSCFGPSTCERFRFGPGLRLRAGLHRRVDPRLGRGPGFRLLLKPGFQLGALLELIARSRFRLGPRQGLGIRPDLRIEPGQLLRTDPGLDLGPGRGSPGLRFRLSLGRFARSRFRFGPLVRFGRRPHLRLHPRVSGNLGQRLCLPPLPPLLLETVLGLGQPEAQLRHLLLQGHGLLTQPRQLLLLRLEAGLLGASRLRLGLHRPAAPLLFRAHLRVRGFTAPELHDPPLGLGPELAFMVPVAAQRRDLRLQVLRLQLLGEPLLFLSDLRRSELRPQRFGPLLLFRDLLLGLLTARGFLLQFGLGRLDLLPRLVRLAQRNLQLGQQPLGLLARGNRQLVRDRWRQIVRRRLIHLLRREFFREGRLRRGRPRRHPFQRLRRGALGLLRSPREPRPLRRLLHPLRQRALWTGSEPRPLRRLLHPLRHRSLLRRGEPRPLRRPLLPQGRRRRQAPFPQGRVQIGGLTNRGSDRSLGLQRERLDRWRVRRCRGGLDVEEALLPQPRGSAHGLRGRRGARRWRFALLAREGGLGLELAQAINLLAEARIHTACLGGGRRRNRILLLFPAPPLGGLAVDLLLHEPHLFFFQESASPHPLHQHGRRLRFDGIQGRYRILNDDLLDPREQGLQPPGLGLQRGGNRLQAQGSRVHPEGARRRGDGRRLRRRLQAHGREIHLRQGSLLGRALEQRMGRRGSARRPRGRRRDLPGIGLLGNLPPVDGLMGPRLLKTPGVLLRGGAHHLPHELQEALRIQRKRRHRGAVALDGLSQHQHPGLMPLGVLEQLIQDQVPPAALDPGGQNQERGQVVAKGDEGIRDRGGEDDLMPLAREQPADGGNGGDVVVDEEDRGGHGSRASLQHGPRVHVDCHLDPGRNLFQLHLQPGKQWGERRMCRRLEEHLPPRATPNLGDGGQGGPQHAHPGRGRRHAAGEEVPQHPGHPGGLLRVLPFQPDGHQPGVRGICQRPAPLQFLLGKAVKVMGEHALHGLGLRVVRLHQHPAWVLAPPGPARHLGEQVEGALRSPEIRNGQ
ncbi:hypothetical protein STIAU_2106 [Stigmatella aurantiaca DW4/3-1]|uniref:Uncharacterized protein n=1 Tax=Stigmatella aurantiaca (strain DW4/3-1) TaxID=378806 RepID=Q09CM2_STIAD|nr:hypothetical protein STIAU_2106 [Stigmatella aurantiaca DW4/3-1]